MLQYPCHDCLTIGGVFQEFGSNSKNNIWYRSTLLKLGCTAHETMTMEPHLGQPLLCNCQTLWLLQFHHRCPDNGGPRATFFWKRAAGYPGKSFPDSQTSAFYIPLVSSTGYNDNVWCNPTQSLPQPHNEDVQAKSQALSTAPLKLQRMQYAGVFRR